MFRRNVNWQEVSYLGHVSSSGVVAMDVDKVQAIMRWTTPKNFERTLWVLGAQSILP